MKKSMFYLTSLVNESRIARALRSCLNCFIVGFLSLTLVSCGGGSSSGGASGNGVVPTLNNVLAVVVDGGPAGAGSVVNQPYVSVTICRPGTSVCQTIDHILLDTGSFGLRIIAPGILNNALNLQAVSTAAGLAVGECVQFASGYQWGSVQLADVKMADEVALSLPIHIVADPSAMFSSVPNDCKSTGLNIGSVKDLGANGVLGVGLFKEDCGTGCAAAAIAGTYYGCNNNACTNISLPLTQQVANPVASFARNNNGVLLTMPAVAVGGAINLTGSLIFGIGTQSNNAFITETAYAANGQGNFTTTYNGKALSASYLDSGSNGYYFDDKNIRACANSTGFYCPLGGATLSATNSSFDGRISGVVSFRLEDVDTLNANITAIQIGGTVNNFSSGFSSNSFDWGLPFFFGRRVFVAIENANTPKGRGPYWAY